MDVLVISMADTVASSEVECYSRMVLNGANEMIWGNA